MKIYLGIMAALLLLGTIEEHDKKDKRMYAMCFCITVIAMALVTIL